MLLEYPFFFENKPSASTGLNSSPYLIDWLEFVSKYSKESQSAQRTDLFKSLEACILETKECFNINYLLLGGSFIQSGIEDPKDIDCLVNVSPKSQASPKEVSSRLIDIRARSLGRKVDVRFVPTTLPLMIQLRMFGFFVGLYSISRGDYVLRKGCLLVDMKGHNCD